MKKTDPTGHYMCTPQNKHGGDIHIPLATAHVRVHYRYIVCHFRNRQIRHTDM